MAKISQILFFIIFSLIFVNGFTSTITLEAQNAPPDHHHHHHGYGHGKAKIGVYELKRGNFSVKFTNYGATLISLVFPDKFGKLADVVLGYDSVKDYVNDTTYFGAVVGRVANRIAGAQFTLNGTHYQLVPNEGKNMLHGGSKGFSRVVWTVEKYNTKSPSPYISFTYFSHDKEEGFPGDLKVEVTYMLIDDHQMSVKMTAMPLTKATPVNLAQHTYWNLGGYNSGSILSDVVQIFGSDITPVNSQLIPTGKFLPVKGTPYDFLRPHTVGSRINMLPNGYDINYVLDKSTGRSKGIKSGRSLNRVAIVKHKKTGRQMELFTNQPGVQFYTSNQLKGVKGKGGYVYQPHAGLCLETQGFPDAVNHPNFPSVIVNRGQTYEHLMFFKFSIV